MMDLNGVEQVDFNALGGPDTITVGITVDKAGHGDRIVVTPSAPGVNVRVDRVR